MSEPADNLILEHLKKIPAEQSAARLRDSEVLARLGGIESALARLGRDSAGHYAELIEDRHALDALKARIERIERRLELT